MNISSQIAKHLRDVHTGGNWTVSNLKDQLADISWQESITKIDSFNTIAALLYHINYFSAAVIPVLKGGPLNAHDKFSYDHPPVNSQNDWEMMIAKTLSDAAELAELVEKIPEEKWSAVFVDEKYGTYYRNIHGIIEHAHYHLGQIVMIKKMIRNQAV